MSPWSLRTGLLTALLLAACPWPANLPEVSAQGHADGTVYPDLRADAGPRSKPAATPRSSSRSPTTPACPTATAPTASRPPGTATSASPAASARGASSCSATARSPPRSTRPSTRRGGGSATTACCGSCSSVTSAASPASTARCGCPPATAPPPPPNSRPPTSPSCCPTSTTATPALDRRVRRLHARGSAARRHQDPGLPLRPLKKIGAWDTRPPEHRRLHAGHLDDEHDGRDHRPGPARRGPQPQHADRPRPVQRRLRRRLRRSPARHQLPRPLVPRARRPAWLGRPRPQRRRHGPSRRSPGRPHDDPHRRPPATPARGPSLFSADIVVARNVHEPGPALHAPVPPRAPPPRSPPRWPPGRWIVRDKMIRFERRPVPHGLPRPPRPRAARPTNAPANRVALSRFYLDPREVSVADYQRCVARGECSRDPPVALTSSGPARVEKRRPAARTIHPAGSPDHVRIVVPGRPLLPFRSASVCRPRPSGSAAPRQRPPQIPVGRRAADCARTPTTVAPTHPRPVATPPGGDSPEGVTTWPATSPSGSRLVRQTHLPDACASATRRACGQGNVHRGPRRQLLRRRRQPAQRLPLRPQPRVPASARSAFAASR